MDKDLLTLRQAAGMLGLSYSYLSRILPTIGLSYARVGRGRGTIRIRQDDLDHYIKERTIPRASSTKGGRADG
jgi:excisionase family DNA binding protein